MTKIELDHVSFGYNAATPVLKDVTFTMDHPGLYCIIGPNGVGKSTLVKCINKLLEPTEGDITIDGRSVKDMTIKEVADYVAFVPANSFDCFSMPVIDTILIGRHNKQKWRTTAKDLTIVHKAMNMLDLESLAMHGFNELSAGQHQRVALARGLVQETPVLILDEPTANLDVKHQVYVAEMLRDLAMRSDITVIMICHDLNIAARYAHKIIVMSPPGVVDCVGAPDEVITEDVIRRIYGIDCEIVTFENSPHVILKSTFGADEDALDWQKVLRYVRLLAHPAAAARLGFMLEQHRERLRVPDSVLESLEKLIPETPEFFFRSRRKGRFIRRWNLYVPDEILNEEEALNGEF